MRLIDADAVKADIEKFNRPLCDGYHIKDYVLNQIITDIENQPTVKAIPIEWIKKYLSRLEIISKDNIELGEEGYYNEIITIEKLLSNWEKENADID